MPPSVPLNLPFGRYLDCESLGSADLTSIVEAITAASPRSARNTTLVAQMDTSEWRQTAESLLRSIGVLLSETLVVDLKIEGEVKSPRHAIDFDSAWLFDVVSAIVTKSAEVEFCGLRVDIIDHVDPNTQDRFEATESEAVAIEMMKAMRNVLCTGSHVRLSASLSDMPADGVAPFVDEGTRLRLASNVAAKLLDAGSIRPDDVPGLQFKINLHSRLIHYVHDMIGELDKSGRGHIRTTDTGDAFFIVDPLFAEQLALKSEDVRKKLTADGVQLVSRGTPTAAAFEAAILSADRHPDRIYVSVLDRSKSDELDETYVIARALDAVEQDRHHAIVVDSNVRADVITHTFWSRLRDELVGFLHFLDALSDWDTYQSSNDPAPEDVTTGELTTEIIDVVKRGHLPAAVSHSMAIFDVEHTRELVDELQTWTQGRGTITVVGSLTRARSDGIHRETTYRSFAAPTGTAAPTNVRIGSGSVLSIPRVSYDLVVAGFSTKSIAASRGRLHASVRSMARSLFSGGQVVAAHQLPVKSASRSEVRRLPEPPDIAAIEAAYRDAGLSFEYKHVSRDWIVVDARPVPARHSNARGGRKTRVVHPKQRLYDEVYDPLVARWFKHFHNLTSRARGRSDLVALEQICLQLADWVSTDTTPEMIDVLVEHADAVAWIGQMQPTALSTREDILQAFRHKFRRNVGQAFLEAALVAISAHNFLRTQPVDDPDTVLRSSTGMVALLASLHDDREHAFFKVLYDGQFLWFPQVSATTLAGAIDERLLIPAERFKLVNGQVRFKDRLDDRSDVNGPTVMCPAHRYRDESNARLNDSLWRVVVDCHLRAQAAADVDTVHSDIEIDERARDPLSFEAAATIVVGSRDERLRRAAQMLDIVRRFATRLAAERRVDTERLVEIRAAITRDQYRSLSTLGIDIDYTWFDDIVSALVDGAPFVEVESFATNLYHHVDPCDEPSTLSSALIGVMPHEETGLLMTRLLNELAASACNFRSVARIDDNTIDAHANVGNELRDAFSNAVRTLISDYLPDESSCLVVRMSEQTAKMTQLVDGLRECSHGKLLESDDEIRFVPTAEFVEQLALHSAARQQEFCDDGITVFANGRYELHALEAASFLHGFNQQILHVIIRDKHARAQQDRTYAILRALNLVHQSHHHAAFFDVDLLEPAQVVLAYCALIEHELQRSITHLEYLSSWSDFDPIEYVNRHYSKQLPEDLTILPHIVQYLQSSHRLRSCNLAADVGAGPNLYPAMLIAPFVADAGAIDLIEFSDRNRAYVNSILSTHNTGVDAPSTWSAWELTLEDMGGEAYEGCFERMCHLSGSIFGSIFSLPRSRYDLMTSFFCADSITVSRSEFWRAIRSLARALTPGGTLIAVHTVNSTGYAAGSDTRFPGVSLTLDEIAQAYRDAELNFEITAAGADFAKPDGTTYDGFATVIAKRR